MGILMIRCSKPGRAISTGRYGTFRGFPLAPQSLYTRSSQGDWLRVSCAATLPSCRQARDRSHIYRYKNIFANNPESPAPCADILAPNSNRLSPVRHGQRPTLPSWLGHATRGQANQEKLVGNAGGLRA